MGGQGRAKGKWDEFKIKEEPPRPGALSTNDPSLRYLTFVTINVTDYFTSK